MLIPNPLITFGDSIGKYRFIAEVATGGMGVIYLAARHGPAGFSQLVAVKELKPEYAQESNFVGMFLEEGRMAARFSHPNIVQTLETDQHDGRYFIVMEYLEGRSFGKIEQKFAPLGGFPVWMSLSIICDVLSALDYVHELGDEAGRPLGFVHRDVSPQNIFVTYDGYTKVIDFGIAKSRDSAQQTQNGVLKGKLSYMAPEQLAHDASKKSDIFSVGAILYEVVAGHLLWHGKSDVDIFGHLSRGEIPPLDTPRGDPALIAICKKALSVKPENRFESAGEMREAIADHLWRSGKQQGINAAGAIGATVQEAFASQREQTRSLIRTYFAQLEHGYRGPLQKLQFERTATGIAAPSVAPIVVTPPGGNDFEDFERKTVETPAPVLLLTKGFLQHYWWTHRREVSVAVVLALVVGLAIVFWPRHAGHSPEVRAMEMHAPLGAAAPPPQAIPPPQVPPPALPETVVLSVTAAPANAQVAIDGKPMPSNPFLGRVPTSAGTHMVRVTAPGYFPKERLVSFADNVMLDLNLNAKPEPRDPPQARRREPPPQRRPAPVPAPQPVAAPIVAAPRAPADIPARTDAPRRRRIETSNPYQEDQ